MNKIFSAYAVREDDQDDGPEVFLNLPATAYEIMDALDVLRLDGESRVNFMVDDFNRFSSLVHFLGEPNDLYALNALAQKLSELDDRQTVAFEGLLEIESQILKEAPHGLPDLIDIAYSTDCCHVVDDAQLGRFRADNGFMWRSCPVRRSATISPTSPTIPRPASPVFIGGTPCPPRRCG